MKIKLVCNSCGEHFDYEVSEICRIWEEQYLKRRDELGEDFGLYVQAECIGCGGITIYDTPIFKHIFRIMFDEYLANQ